MKLVVLDVGCGNIGSVGIAFGRLGAVATVSADPERIAGADRVVIPGVGAAGFAMEQIRRRGLEPLLRALTQPVLGICLGMQLLFESSDEGDTACLGILAGRVSRMMPGPGRPVPHMGWSRLDVGDGGLGLSSGDYVYFAHGFACPDGPATIASTVYGGVVPAVVRKDNWLGAQFHPERSGEAGRAFLERWIAA